MEKEIKGNVLLVDDNRDELNTIKKGLESEGYYVEAAENGKEGFAKIKEFHADIIVSDVNMPVMDGYELCEKVRGMQQFEHIPFMFISKSIDNDQDRIKGLKLGADDFVQRPILPEEIILRVNVVLKRLKILRRLTITDEVTGLKNRRYFDQRLDEEIEKLKRYGRPMGVFIIDIDNFKGINDTHGHFAGDEVLKSIGVILENSLRKSDIIARYGGDEFTMILPEHSEEAIIETAERLRKNIQDNLMHIDEKRMTVTASLGGIWIKETNTSSPSEIIHIADDMLYQAKNAGRNCVKVCMS